MSDALFLADFDEVVPGSVVEVTGDEGRHAAVVKRIRVGESVLVADGRGRAVRGPVAEVGRSSIAVTVDEVLHEPASEVTYRTVQALAKGERQELALEIQTEVGVDEVVAWQSHRSIVRWDEAKQAKGLAKWQATAREATKQSRRFRVPAVHGRVLTTKELVADIAADPGLVLVLHEEATDSIATVELPRAGRVSVVVGPEGGIAPEELEAMVAAGAVPVLVSDGVLRASTAAAVAIVQLRLRRELGQ